MLEYYRRYKHKETTDDTFCDRWTFLTTCCYKYKMNCKLCPNEIVCQRYNNNRNKYKIHPVKYAMLLTYAKLGKPNLQGGYFDTRNE